MEKKYYEITKILENKDVFTIINEYTRTEFIDHWQNEQEIEKNLINHLIKLGYEYREDIKDEDSLISNLRAQIGNINDYMFDNTEWDEIYNNFINKNSDDSLEKVEKIQKDGYVYQIKTRDGKRKNINLIFKSDKEKHKNRLQVINQYKTTNNRRFDVTILVNGLPLIHIELKNKSVLIESAFNQIQEYKKEKQFTGLYGYVNIFIISNGEETKYFANNQIIKDDKARDLNSFELTSYWSDKKNNLIKDLHGFTNHFLNQNAILNIINKYCIFNTENELLIMRPYQIAACESIINKLNIVINKPNLFKNEDSGGYIWHTTGSGKTITSFKTVQLIRDNIPEVKKTLFVVDRLDLDDQTAKEYNKFEKNSANACKSSKELERLINDDSIKMIVTTIQKLNIFVNRNKDHKIFNERVVMIFDECHRSQFGEMHLNIINKFKKYNIFGFTGTPIFTENANTTFKTNLSSFKKLDKRLLTHNTTKQLFGEELHSYKINDAIKHNNVLRFHYENYNTVESKDKIEDLKIPGIDKNKIWLADERISKISHYILNRFNQICQRNKENSIKFLNSIFAVSSIEAAKKYYTKLRELNEKLNMNLKICTIFSYNQSDFSSLNDDNDYLYYDENNEDIDNLNSNDFKFMEEVIDNYNKEFRQSYSTDSKGFHNYYIDVSKNMKDCKIDILIVVNMFLTGFDAKCINTLWLDKDLKYHGLVQAFSRTNRIFNSNKTVGNIISFRNIDKNVEEAFRLFAQGGTNKNVFIGKFDDHYPKYTKDINYLLEKYPLDLEIYLEDDKKGFINLFNEVLKLRTLLSVFDEFTVDKHLINDGQLQSYLSKYNTIYHEYKKKNKEKVDVSNDILFKLELISKYEIGLDYLKNFIWQNKDMDSDKLITNVKSQIDSTLELRSKKELILEFINQINTSNSIPDLFSQDLFNKFFNEFNLNTFYKEIRTFCDNWNDNYSNIIKLFQILFKNDEFDIRNSQYTKNFLLFGASKKKQEYNDGLKLLFEKYNNIINYNELDEWLNKEKENG